MNTIWTLAACGHVIRHVSWSSRIWKLPTLQSQMLRNTPTGARYALQRSSKRVRREELSGWLPPSPTEGTKWMAPTSTSCEDPLPKWKAPQNPVAVNYLLIYRYFLGTFYVVFTCHVTIPLQNQLPHHIASANTHTCIASNVCCCSYKGRNFAALRSSKWNMLRITSLYDKIGFIVFLGSRIINNIIIDIFFK